MSHEFDGLDFDHTQLAGQLWPKPDRFQCEWNPHDGLPRCRRLRFSGARYFLNVSAAATLVTQRHCAISSIRMLLCTFILVAAGCGSEESNSKIEVMDPAEAQAHIDELLKGVATNFPPDTPESLLRKQEQSREKFEQADEATTEGDHSEAVRLLTEALYLDPTHRAARLQLAVSLQTRSEETIPTDLWLAGKDIRTAGFTLNRLRTDYQDFSEDELRIMSEIYFDEARDYGRGINLEEEFAEALGNAMSTGYSNLERLKTEPDIARFRTNPKTSGVIDNAIASLEAGEKDDPEAEPAEDEDSDPD